jgi:predicted transcriptional regulator
MVRRSKMEIYIDILQVISEGNVKPTHVMYKANLSWARLMKHIRFLQSQDLLTIAQGSGVDRYEITEKGREVLSYFRKLEGALYYGKGAIPSEVIARYR